MAAKLTSADRMRLHREAFQLGVEKRVPLRVAQAMIAAKRAADRHAAVMARLTHRRAQRAARAAASTPSNRSGDARWMMRD